VQEENEDVLDSEEFVESSARGNPLRGIDVPYTNGDFSELPPIPVTDNILNII
jgi:hypothetical protein